MPATNWHDIFVLFVQVSIPVCWHPSVMLLHNI